MAGDPRLTMASVFPDLADDPNFKVLSEPSEVYNCIAWAMGFDDRWVAPEGNSPGVWWPSGIEPAMTPEALIRAFEAVGFAVCGDDGPESGYDKVVLYRDPGTGEWTHAARIVSATTEYSKFGPMWDATHSHDVLCRTGVGWESQSYGVAYACMKRPVSCRREVELTGSVEVDREGLKRHGLFPI